MNTLLYDFSRSVIDTLICNPINSKNGLKLSIDTPLNNDACLNIHRPAVLRQYFGREVENYGRNVERYTYGSGSGTSSVGMDPKNFVTRSISVEMDSMIDDIHGILCNNRKQFNLDGIDLSTKFNHCTVLIYYAGKGLKKSTSLGFHTDCVYSPSTGEYMKKCNSQKINTPAVIYSIGDMRKLNWKCRHASNSSGGKMVWKPMDCDNMSYELDSDTLSIIHPHDEDPNSEMNRNVMSQYMHGNVNVYGEKFSVGLVFRVVNETRMYHACDDTMQFDNCSGHGDVVNGILGIDLMSFHWNLLTLYRNTLY